jgi:putative FmdB family regulatory protein
MALREYYCKNCGVFEIIQKINDENLQVCPTCQSKVEKLQSIPACAIFKGPGFYATDYKSKTKKES